ncbi:MAG: nitric oxide reductase transcriptional regulator NorR [Myxococcales bacterium]|nr:nitric oxide reductase transcriptional regulator NorR [Myxococcales bacterium]
MREPFLDIALDLCANLAAEDRYRRLAAAVRRLIPCDSTAIMRLDQGVLVPVVGDGLLPETIGRRFIPEEHPRLQKILQAGGPVRFRDSTLPDPFDGLIAGGSHLTRVHACMGCPLILEGKVVGVIAVDALDPKAFDGVYEDTLATVAALAGSAMRTTGLVESLERVLAHKSLVAEHLQIDARRRIGDEVLGISPIARRLRDEISIIARSDLTALITGETGVGKEVVARAIHAQSSRAQQPLIYVNCAALPEGVAESELFGHVRGAFTGATDKRAGKFEAADGGTLFLDELGELPLSVQPKLLRALQTGEVQRVGSDRSIHVDVRVLAATNRELREEVRLGRFRADLYHRLSVYPLHVPPLRERVEDVLLLAGYFLDLARSKLGVGQVKLTHAARSRLVAYDWPGNVRELEHLMLRATLRAAEGSRRQDVLIDAEHLGIDDADVRPKQHATASSVERDAPVSTSLAESVDAFRRQLIRSTVEKAGGNWAEAARVLGVDRGNLHRMAQRLGLLS